jgi:hypothetical protein
MQENCLTPLDEKLRELACSDWSAFVSLIGMEVISRAKVCLLKKEEKSIRFIANKLKISKGKVESSCKKCPDS